MSEQRVSIWELPQVYREALAVFEALRKLGFSAVLARLKKANLVDEELKS